MLVSSVVLGRGMALILGCIAVRVVRAVEPGGANELKAHLYPFAMIKRMLYILTLVALSLQKGSA
jgi:hypothetical protein